MPRNSAAFLSIVFRLAAIATAALWCATRTRSAATPTTPSGRSSLTFGATFRIGSSEDRGRSIGTIEVGLLARFVAILVEVVTLFWVEDILSIGLIWPGIGRTGRGS